MGISKAPMGVPARRRNPTVIPVRTKTGSGPHGKSHKAARRDEKVRLRGVMGDPKGVE